MTYIITDEHPDLKEGKELILNGNPTLPYYTKIGKRKRHFAEFEILDWLKQNWIIDKINYHKKILLSLDIIMSIVCDYLGVNKEAMQKKCRKRELVIARQFSHFFAKEYSGKTFEVIGNEIGNVDHSTVSASINRIKDLCDVYSDIRIKKEEMTKLLENARIYKTNRETS